MTQNYRVGVSGGTDKLNYNLAYSYYDEEGAMVYSGNKKHNISFNMNHKLNDRLSITARISYDQMKIYGMGTFRKVVTVSTRCNISCSIVRW